MAKIGQDLVCVLNEEEVNQWVDRVNACLLTIAMDFLKRSGVDISKVTSIEPIEIGEEVDDEPYTFRIVKDVKIEFFQEE